MTSGSVHDNDAFSTQSGQLPAGEVALPSPPQPDNAGASVSVSELRTTPHSSELLRRPADAEEKLHAQGGDDKQGAASLRQDAAVRRNESLPSYGAPGSYVVPENLLQQPLPTQESLRVINDLSLQVEKVCLLLVHYD